MNDENFDENFEKDDLVVFMNFSEIKRRINQKITIVSMVFKALWPLFAVPLGVMILLVVVVIEYLAEGCK